MVRRTLAVHRNVPAVVVEPLEATLTPHLDTGLQLNLLQFRRHIRRIRIGGSRIPSVRTLLNQRIQSGIRTATLLCQSFGFHQDHLRYAEHAVVDVQGGARRGFDRLADTDVGREFHVHIRSHLIRRTVVDLVQRSGIRSPNILVEIILTVVSFGNLVIQPGVDAGDIRSCQVVRPVACRAVSFVVVRITQNYFGVLLQAGKSFVLGKVSNVIGARW